jgi:hypothetical protein
MSSTVINSVASGCVVVNQSVKGSKTCRAKTALLVVEVTSVIIPDSSSTVTLK